MTRLVKNNQHDLLKLLEIAVLLIVYSASERHKWVTEQTVRGKKRGGRSRALAVNETRFPVCSAVANVILNQYFTRVTLNGTQIIDELVALNLKE